MYTKIYCTEPLQKNNKNKHNFFNYQHRRSTLSTSLWWQSWQKYIAARLRTIS